jgi:hypothetical protein
VAKAPLYNQEARYFVSYHTRDTKSHDWLLGNTT